MNYETFSLWDGHVFLATRNIRSGSNVYLSIGIKGRGFNCEIRYEVEYQCNDCEKISFVPIVAAAY